MAEAFQKIEDIAEGVLRSNEARSGGRDEVVRLLDKFTNNKFSDTEAMKRGALNLYLDQLSVATDPDEIRELLKVVMRLSETIK